jgi:transitional endoplasmic reticulum ATPase
MLIIKTGASNNNNDIDSTKEKTKSVNLKIAEVAEQRDIGRKIVRIDPKIAERLNISTGDALELSSLRKKTTVLSWPARESDRGKGLIRVDGYTRNKLDVSINDTIDIKKVESKDAFMLDLREHISKYKDPKDADNHA